MVAALVLALVTAAAQPGLPQVIRLRPRSAPQAQLPQSAEPEPEPEPAAKAQQTLPPRASLAGEWSLGVAGRSTRCRMTLSGQMAEQGRLIAALGSNCPPGLFAVTRWQLTATELILATRSGRTMARLKPRDGGWQGPTSEGRDAMMEKLPSR